MKHEFTNEPVAWMQPDEVHISLWKDEYHTVPLYLHPQDQKKDEALRLALEALKSLFSGKVDNDRAKRCSDAITLIEQALENK